MIRKGISVFLALCLMLTLLPVSALAEGETSGTCGESATWTFDTTSKTLTISGTGATEDYNLAKYPSWWVDWHEEIEKVVVTRGIEKIGRSLLYGYGGYPKLTSVSLPDSVIELGEGIFSGCSKLENVSLPAHITEIPRNTFYKCSSLETVPLPAGITKIGVSAFEGCASLKTINLPSGLTDIETSAFAKSGLTSIELPEGLVNLSGFFECTALKNVVIPRSVQTIGSSAFYKCGLTSVTIPNTVKSFGGQTFDRCPDLKSAVFEDGCTTVAANMFDGCTSLETVELPESITRIQNSAFSNCTSLKSINLPNNLHVESNAFNNTGLTEINVPGSVILPNGGRAFWNCANLRKVVFNDGLTSIGTAWLEDCTTLQEIHIPVSVRTVNESAFADCTGLTSVYYGGTAQQWKEIIIRDYNENLLKATIYDVNGNVISSESPVPTGDPKILGFSPESGAEFPGTVFDITFDREIAERASNKNSPEVDLTLAEPFRVHRASDDSVVYTPSEFSWPQFTYGPSRSILRITPNYSSANGGTLVPGEQYYITMGAGFVKFTDGKTSPEIKKGDWLFMVKEPTHETPGENTSFTVDITFGNGFGNSTESIAWDDNWFLNPGTTYNHNLAVASLALSGSTYASDNGAEIALKRLGFKNAQSYSYDSPFWENILGDGTVGHTFAIKNIQIDGKSCALVAVVIRGTQGVEWASNILDSGMVDWDSGFDDASRKVLENLNQYLADNQVDTSDKSTVKFLVTGHSRGGVVANLVAADLTTNTVLKKAPNAFGNDVYSYTVASPRISFITSSGNGCNNIFNIINPRDVVPKLPTKEGYERYGVNLFLPSRYNFQKQAGGQKYVDFSGKMESTFYSLTNEVFYDNFVLFTMKSTACAHSIAAYYSWMGRYSAQELFGDVNKYSAPIFKKIVVACPVDVYVYYEDGETAASVINEKIVKEDLLIEVENGVKTIYLPMDQDYDIRVEAREKGTVHYTVSEMVLESGGESATRTVNFNEIVIAKGDVLAGTINDIPKTPVSDYTLTKTTESGVTTTIPAASDTLPSNPAPAPGGNTSTGGSSSSRGGGSSSGVGYSISVPGKLTGGKVSVSPSSARKGSTVTVTVTLEEGYMLDKLTVKDSKGTELSLTEKGSGKYTFTMPGAKVTVDAAIIPISGDSNRKTVFTDVQPGAYYYDAVGWAVEQGITNGTTDMTFSPNQPCTRAQIVTFLWRAAGSPKASGSNPFTDVDAGSYYYDAVQWAVEQGVTAGTTDTTFSPNNACTRAQAVTFLYRSKQAESSGETEAGQNLFTDVNPDSYYAKAVLWAVDNGVTSGVTASTFSPDTTCTRAQIVTFLYRSQTN